MDYDNVDTGEVQVFDRVITKHIVKYNNKLVSLRKKSIAKSSERT